MTKFWSNIIVLGLFCIVSIACQDTQVKEKQEEEAVEEKTHRIISLDGSITELIYTLGLGDQLVATDVTSTFPEEAKSKATLGHVRQLSVEGVLALNPTMIFIAEEATELEAVKLLANSPNIELVSIPIESSMDGPVKAAEAIASALALEQEETISTLKTKLEQEQAVLQNIIDTINRPKVLFIYARGTKTLMVAGTDTPTEKMIQLAGGQNAISEFDGFKPLTPEALLQAQPDVLLLFESGIKSLADEQQGLDAEAGLLAIPGISQTPAGKAKRIITMDGQYLCGFGPRVGEAAIELATALKQSGFAAN